MCIDVIELNMLIPSDTSEGKGGSRTSSCRIECAAVCSEHGPEAGRGSTGHWRATSLSRESTNASAVFSNLRATAGEEQ